MSTFEIPAEYVITDERTGCVYLKPGVVLKESYHFKDMVRFHLEQAEWSQFTFGTDTERGPIGPLKHLAKELLIEVLGLPKVEVEIMLEGSKELRIDIMEYVDMLCLVFDASRRAGYSYDAMLEACWKKLEINRSRKWIKTDNNSPVEHDRSGE